MEGEERGIIRVDGRLTDYHNDPPGQCIWKGLPRAQNQRRGFGFRGSMVICDIQAFEVPLTLEYTIEELTTMRL